MNSLAAHVEYLLRKHDCVVLPGIGALLCNYVAAHFSTRGDDTFIMPPGRSLVFNGLICDSDGLLASSVARKEGIPYEAAASQVRDGMAMLRRQLDDCGEFQFGRLGVFSKGDEGQICFEAMALPSVNGAFYGLSPLQVTPVEQLTSYQSAPGTESAEAGEESVRMLEAPASGTRWSAYISGIAAALALVVTCVLFFMSPIRTDRNTQTASIAPVAVEGEKAKAADDGVTIIEANPSEADNMAEAADPVSVTGMSEAAEPVATPVAEPAAEPVAEPVATPAAEPAKPAVRAKETEPSAGAPRLNVSDPYCVIVASFPTEGQAREYISGHRQSALEILEKDGRFRVYAATGESYAAANAWKNRIGQSDAWICRR